MGPWAGRAGGGPGWRNPERVLAAVVLGLGAFVIVGTADVTTASSALGLGPRFFPFLVGGAMIVVGVCYVIDVLRGGRGDPEQSEDIDTRTPADLRTVAIVSAIFLAFAVTVDVLGWIVGSALLFFGLAVTLGARRRIRAAAIAIALAVGTHLLFVKGLGVTLPGGLLTGVI